MLLHHFLLTAFSFLLTAVIFIPIFKRLGLGSILGYLTAGAVIGPWGLGAINDVETVSSYAELGVVLLLFVIGLELQPRRLWTMRAQVFGLGGLQVLLTTLILGSVLAMSGLSITAALICAFALSSSSTAFALQTLGERNELKTMYGQSAFAVLLFQDMAAIPFLALIPLLANPQIFQNISLLPVGRVFAVIIGVIVAGRYLLRPVFRVIASTQAREIFTSAALLLVIGVALVMEQQGLSMALGSFLAGMLLAESEYRHEVEANVEPFKGLLLGLFFIAVGMAVDFGLILHHFVFIFACAVGLMIAKATILTLLARAFKVPFAAAKNVGVLLSQAGEFGFVIFALAKTSGEISEHQADLLVAIVTMSMALMPLGVLLNDKLIQPLFNQAVPDFDDIQDDGPQVIIAGFGRVGQITGRLLRVLWIPFTALEIDAEQVEVLRKFGSKVYYGDASRVDLLEMAGAAKAEIFVLAIDDPETSRNVAATVKKHFPHLKVVARARNRQHVFDLLDEGVEDVFRETYVSSLEMAEFVLGELGMPDEKARDTITRFRAHDEKTLIEQYNRHGDEKELIAYSKEASRQLEKTFMSDT